MDDRSVKTGKRRATAGGFPLSPQRSLAVWIRAVDEPERIVWWYLCFAAGIDPDRGHTTDVEQRPCWQWARDEGRVPDDQPVVVDMRTRLRARTTLVAYAHGLPAQHLNLQAHVQSVIGAGAPEDDLEMQALTDDELQAIADGDAVERAIPAGVIDVGG